MFDASWNFQSNRDAQITFPEGEWQVLGAPCLPSIASHKTKIIDK